MTDDHSGAASAIIRFFRAVDTRDWEQVIALLSDTVAVDYTSLFGGDPETVSRTELATRWRDLLPGFDATQHFLGPLLHTSTGTVECNVRGHHALDGEVWMVAGWYVLTVGPGRADEPFQISGISLTVSYETGSRELVDQAQRRVSAR